MLIFPLLSVSNNLKARRNSSRGSRARIIFSTVDDDASIRRVRSGKRRTDAVERIKGNESIGGIELAEEFQDFGLLEIEAEGANGDLELVVVQFRIFVDVEELERFPDLVRLIAAQRWPSLELRHGATRERGKPRGKGGICCFFSSFPSPWRGI